MAGHLSGDTDAGELLDRVIGWLHKVGIDLGPCGLQTLLLAICIVLAAGAAAGAISSNRKIKKSDAAKRIGFHVLTALLSVGVFIPGAVVATIVFVWVAHLVHPLEGLVEGRVTATRHTGVISLSLLDAVGQQLGTADVDVASEFDLPFRQCFCDEPKQLTIKIDGCKDENHKINRDDILRHSRGRQELEVLTTCEPL
jgi:hypothetical protein